MQAVIMAGGFGTRLRPLSSGIPKPMVPMANKPMLYHIIKLLKAHGFKDIVMMLYYQPEVIMDYFGDGSSLGVKINYLKPDMDLGTAGSVGFAKDKLKETFVVISGDVLTDINITEALKFHKDKKSLATMILTRVTNPLSYGVVITEEDGKIERFLEKPSWGEVFSDTVNSGIYILEREVLGYIPTDRSFDFSKELYPQILRDKKPLYGFIAGGYWKDVGNLEEYRLAHYDILDKKIQLDLEGSEKIVKESRIIYGNGTKISDSIEVEGNVVIGENTVIEKGARLIHSVIGSNVRVRAGAAIKGSVIWDSAKIGRDARCHESVIGKGTEIGNNATIQVGTIISDHCTIGSGAVVRANIKIWPHKTVEEGATVSSSLVWGEKWNRALFGAYGITGIGNIEITPEFASKVGAAYGVHIGKNSYVITSRDASSMGRMIKRALISGIMSAGVRVGDLRTTPIPVIRYELGKEGEAGGIHVRQSPYDRSVVDIKIFDASGSDISVREEKSIEGLFLKEDFKRASVNEIGELTVPSRAQEYYKEGLLKNIDKQVIAESYPKVVIDYAHSSASMVFPGIVGELGVDMVALNAYTDSHKITKTTEEFKKSLSQLEDIVPTVKANAGFLFDNGAEKVFLVDEKGKAIRDDIALIIVSELVMRFYKKGTIAVPVHVSGAVEKLAKKYKIKVIRTGASPRQIMSAAREKDVVFVGDCFGGFIFPEFQTAFDAMFATCKIIEMMAKEKVRLSELKKDLPYFEVIHKKLHCPWDKKGKVMRMAIDDVKGKSVELIDGVKVNFPDGSWVLMLPDPNEAYFHVWAESTDKKNSRTLLNEYTKKVRKWQGK